MLIYVNTKSKLTRKQKANRDERVRQQAREFETRCREHASTSHSRLQSTNQTPPAGKGPIPVATIPNPTSKAEFHERLRKMDEAANERVTPQYEGEMLERELAARAEAERRKGQTAPLYNKGAYQYITPETDLKTMGKK